MDCNFVENELMWCLVSSVAMPLPWRFWWISPPTTHATVVGIVQPEAYGWDIVTHHSQPKTDGRVALYPALDASLRTDDSFRKRLQLKHRHKDGCKSIIEDVLDDVIALVELNYMHLVCIGVRKKDVNTWVSGKSDKHRFCDQTMKIISAYLVAIGE